MKATLVRALLAPILLYTTPALPQPSIPANKRVHWICDSRLQHEDDGALSRRCSRRLDTGICIVLTKPAPDSSWVAQVRVSTDTEYWRTIHQQGWVEVKVRPDGKLTKTVYVDHEDLDVPRKDAFVRSLLTTYCPPGDLTGGHLTALRAVLDQLAK